ncbi:putative ammonium transporter 2 isoform X1 [Episyrphus balteatus]|uniref:putative ammonium transporter 2 isoform X1 n=1 Tax=Episyrphus balteatus TaxID=286459 RepID=UPI0024865214|nr:putative ammonium transporter 2 isoform X1 [Episyrphus balteatus]
MTTKANVTASQATALKGVFRNGSYVIPGVYDLSVEDTNWVLTSSFIIFTMQTGFGMLESGCVSIKNEVNIMMKNVVDIVLGGFTYWLFGYGMSFGRGPLSNPFIAIGDFLIDPPVGDPLMGQIFSAFLFQLSFATTATTIVSGAMAERTNFKAYCLFSLLNTAVYCIPAGWVWGEHGFLNNLGAVDIAGSGPVHLIGGASAFASAAMLGPRLGRYADGYDPLPLGNPVNACMGLFVLWWGWLAFNSGSTYGVSGAKWQYAARAAVMTMLGSFGGGVSSLGYSLWRNEGRLDIIDLINGILGSLVSITAGCFLFRAWEALLIGALGALLCCVAMPLFDRLGVDDPVGASAVHGVCGIWGVLAVGLFADNPIPLGTTKGRTGLFKGGGWYLLGIQSLSAFCLVCWGICSTFLLLYIVNKIIPIRMEPNEELLGADLMEHRIRHSQIGLSRAISALAPLKIDLEEIVGIRPIGLNPGHEKSLDELRAAEDKLNQWRSYLDQMGPTKRKSQASLSDDSPSTAVRRKSIAGNSLSKKIHSLRGKIPETTEHVAVSGVGGVFKNKNAEVPTVSKGKDNGTFAWID